MPLRAHIPLAVVAVLVAAPAFAQTAPAPTPVVTTPAAPEAPATTKASGKAGCMKDRHAMS